MVNVQKYDIFEMNMSGVSRPVATFTNSSTKRTIQGFHRGTGEFTVRFMPEEEGNWQYCIKIGESETVGEFNCIANTGNNYGPVIACGTHFQYADGTQYIPVGTTCYAWIHQGNELMSQTLQTLSGSPFNKIRMCVFPKHMPFNNNEPELFPFERNEAGKWDINKPVERFWLHLENSIVKLCELGIETDLILFHPYDCWGFSSLSLEDCLSYLDYCICRLSAYRNVWWSLANEYDVMFKRQKSDWDIFGEKMAKEDVYKHLISIHHCFAIYPKRDWMTHCSIQTKFVHRAAEWQKEYDLPVIIDECGYEGDIEFNWGNLSAFELIHRAWITITSGGFITHGETFFREDEVLWWAKGGKLYGQTPARFAFLKTLQYEMGNIEPIPLRMFQNPNDNTKSEDSSFKNLMLSLPEFERRSFEAQFTQLAARNENYRLQYVGRYCPSRMDVHLPENGEYKVEVIDIWDMTRTIAPAEARGCVRIKLPGKEGIAVLVTRISGDVL